jgi:ankyrin repeat protein
VSKTALFKACKAWDAKAAGEILAADPSLIAALDSKGRTALHLCAGVPLTPERSADASVATVKALLAAGVDLNAIQNIPNDGEIFPATALWYACSWGKNPTLAAYLLTEGANPDNCLFCVVWSNDVALLKLLLRAGSDTELRFGGETPLHYAARLGREEALFALVGSGAQISARDRKDMTPLDHARKKQLSSKVIALLRAG